MKRVTVIGGCNVDICATSLRLLVKGDSNPGTVRVSLGGVGRNIAENLAKLGQKVSLISALGGDQFTELLTRHAQVAGFDMSLCAHDETLQNSVYVCVNEPDGEMSVAVSDMRVCDILTPELIKLLLPQINDSSLVAIDANIPEATVKLLAEQCTAPLCADTVSSKKAVRLMSALPRLELLKTNRIEAHKLTGMSVSTNDEVQLCARRLHEIGVKRVLFTLGADGAYASDGEGSRFMPTLARDIVNTTGCGDSFFSGAIYAWLSGESVDGMLKRGLGMAALCATEQGAVCQSASVSALDEYIEHNMHLRG